MAKRLATALLSAAACALASCAALLGERPQRIIPPSVGKAPYGELPDGGSVDIYTLTNANGMRVRVLNYGATLVSLEIPDKDGRVADVALGYDTLDAWLANPARLGAVLGRYAGPIANATFRIGGKAHKLAANHGPHHLDGGTRGLDKTLWHAQPFQTSLTAGVRFTCLSPDGDQGYPGNLAATVVYTLYTRNELKIELKATTDKPTVVNLAHRGCWNLAGQGSGDVRGHLLTIFADQVTPTNPAGIPTGELKPVVDTPLDFSAPTPIGKHIAAAGGRYHHNFVLRSQGPRIAMAARAYEPASGRILEIHTNQPGLLFSTGQLPKDGPPGKGGVAYGPYAGFILQAQRLPDTPNHPAFPSAVLRPGETYRQVVLYKFSVRHPRRPRTY